MTLLSADYVILSVAAAAGIAGLFIGFSGALAFLAATSVAALGGRTVWMFGAPYFEAAWTRGLVTLLAALVVFGIVRWAVKRMVNGLLKQPADAVFGFLVASLAGFALAAVAVYLANFFGLAEVGSTIVSEATGFLG